MIDLSNSSKLYYSIGEVADMFNVNASLIRFWEKEFDSIKPRKNKKGNRLFTKEDIQNLQLIYHLVKEKGFTLEGAKNEMKGDTKETQRDVEVIQRLKKIREELLKLKGNL